MICKVDGCGNSVHAKGYCNTHYRRYLKFSDPLKTEISPPYRGKKCSVEGCEEVAYKKGMCNKHFQRFKKYGTTELPQKVVVEKQKKTILKKTTCEVCGFGDTQIVRGMCRNCYHSFMMKNVESYRNSKKVSKYKRRSLEEFSESENFTNEEILDKTSGLCSLCFEAIDTSISGSHRLGLTIDHIQPLSMGGNSMKYNLLAAHRVCNSIKQHRWKNSFTVDEYVDKLKVQNEKFWKENYNVKL